MGKMIDQTEREMSGGKRVTKKFAAKKRGFATKQKPFKKGTSKKKAAKKGVNIEMKTITVADLMGDMNRGQHFAMQIFDDPVSVENRLNENNKRLEELTAQVERLSDKLRDRDRAIEDHKKKENELSAAYEHLVAAMYRITIANNI